MKVSRSDIDYSEIDTHSGFLKFSIQGYCDLLNIIPVASQIAIINAINNPKYRFIVAAISRRQGKTYIANIIGQIVGLVPGSAVLIISPNYNLSNISFELSRNLIKHFSLEVTKDNAKDKVIELANGSTIRMGSVNQVDSVVGRSYDLIIFDEAALTSAGEDAFNIALRPTLDKPNSKALFISTPRGMHNWFARFYQRGFSIDPAYAQWISIHATYEDNPRIYPADIEEARATLSDAEFRQEYMADFNVFVGQIWQFNSKKCVQDLSSYNFGRADVIAGLDIGFRDATALCVIVIYDDQYFIVDEYWNREKTTAGHAEQIARLQDKWGIDFIFIDASAAQTRFDLASDYGVSTVNAKKSQNDGIMAVAAVVENDNLIVHSECTRCIESLEQYRWDPNPNLINDKPVHDDFSHMADAIRYAIYSFQINSHTF